MGSWRSGGGLFDANVACGGRRLHLGQRSGAIVSHFLRCVLLRVRPCLAYYEIDQGDTSGRRTHRRFGSFGVSRLSLGAVRELICWRACFSRMANIYRGTRQGWALSVCVFHADFRRATLHVRGLHRHTDSGLDAGTSVLNVLHWSCVYARRDGYRDQDTSASGAGLLGLMFLLWTILLHTPRVFAHIHNKDELTSLFVALAMSGGSFIVAGAVSNSGRRVRQTIG